MAFVRGGCLFLFGMTNNVVVQGIRDSSGGLDWFVSAMKFSRNILERAPVIIIIIFAFIVIETVDIWNWALKAHSSTHVALFLSLSFFFLDVEGNACWRFGVFFLPRAMEAN